MGLKNVELHDDATCLYGYQGDKRPQKANIIVRRKDIGGSSNDIGFELQEDGTYSAQISDYDKRRFNDQWMKDFELHYGAEQARQAFSNEGWSYVESLDNEGNVQLVGTKLGDY